MRNGPFPRVPETLVKTKVSRNQGLVITCGQPGLGDGREAAAVRPLIRVPIQDEVPPAGAPVGIEDVPDRVRAHPDRAEADDLELPLDVRVRRQESQCFRGHRRPEGELLHLGEDLLGLGFAVEVNERHALFNLTAADRDEMLGGVLPDQLSVVAGDPVEPAGFDLLLVGQAIVDRHDVGVALPRATHQFGTLRLRHEQTPSLVRLVEARPSSQQYAGTPEHASNSAASTKPQRSESRWWRGAQRCGFPQVIENLGVLLNKMVAYLVVPVKSEKFLGRFLMAR